jgi:hypothetical protein
MKAHHDPNGIVGKRLNKKSSMISIVLALARQLHY